MSDLFSELFLPSSSLFLTIFEMNWAAACWSESKLSCGWRPTSSKVNRWARLGRQQQRRVQWVWPRSEICGGSFKGQREQRKKNPTGHEPNLCELSQTMTSTRNSQVLTAKFSVALDSPQNWPRTSVNITFLCLSPVCVDPRLKNKKTHQSRFSHKIVRFPLLTNDGLTSSDDTLLNLRHSSPSLVINRGITARWLSS